GVAVGRSDLLSLAHSLAEVGVHRRFGLGAIPDLQRFHDTPVLRRDCACVPRLPVATSITASNESKRPDRMVSSTAPRTTDRPSAPAQSSAPGAPTPRRAPRRAAAP